MRRLVLTVLGLSVFGFGSRTALGTAQVHERIHVNGRVLTMQATPLAALVEGREDLKAVFPQESSNSWRGYVGTWAVEGDRLYLVSLEREEYAEKAYKMVPIPLSAVFGTDETPRAATWFTGTLRIPLTGRSRYVHMGFATTHDRELRRAVVRGVVTSRSVVDGIAEARGRSEADLTWCSLPTVVDRGAPPDDGAWHDARTIGTTAFRDQVPEGGTFRSRGILDRDKSGAWSLWIPATLVTSGVTFAALHLERLKVERTWPHVEVEASWRFQDGRAVLDVRWVRMLKPGETIHHPSFPLPPLVLTEDSDIPPPAEPLPVRLESDVPEVVGRYDAVTLHGRLEGVRGGTAGVLGVDVGADANLAGQAVKVTGYLEKWIVTERLLRLDPPEMAPFRSRGAGTYYRLVDPASGGLARPVRDPDPPAKPEVPPPK